MMNQNTAVKPSETAIPLSAFSLLAASGTLICCALPIALVTLGLGATVASLTSAFPVLVTLSEYKLWVFAFSGLLLLATAWSLYRPGRQCPMDAELAGLCERSQRWGRRLFWLSTVLWAIGFFAAFVALPLRIWLSI